MKSYLSLMIQIRKLTNYMMPFINKSKIFLKSLMVKIFWKFFGTYKKCVRTNHFTLLTKDFTILHVKNSKNLK